MKTVITIWERYVKQEDGSLGWEHNHISEGYSEEEHEPTPTAEVQQRSWKGAQWRKSKGYLVDGKVERA